MGANAFSSRHACRLTVRGAFVCAIAAGAMLSPACRPGSESSVGEATITIAEPEAAEGAAATARGLQLEGLVQLLPNGRSEPLLAESWRWEEAGRRLRIQLRSNVRTHNNTRVTPAMTAAALRTAVNNPDNRKTYWTFENIRSVEADGGDVVIDLTEPTGALPEDLDFALTFDGAGTGPYRVVTEGQNEIVMERFDEYHLGRPAIRQVNFRSGMTRRPAWTSLLRGEVDMVTNVGSDTAQFLGSEQIELHSFLRRYQYVVAFNLRRPPFAASDIRRAMNLAIDRRLIVDTLLSGRGKEATSPMWPSHWAFDETIQGLHYDPKAAAALLDAAGFPVRQTPGQPRSTRFSFTCLIPEGIVVAERISLEVQRQLSRVGIDMRLEVLPFPQYLKRVFSTDYEAAFVDMISGSTFGRIYLFWAPPTKDTGLNVTGYDNPEAARLFDTLRRTRNEAEIRAASRRLQRVFLDDPPALSIAWSERTRAISRRFEVRGPAERDPLLFLWQWTPRPDAVDASNRH